MFKKKLKLYSLGGDLSQINQGDALISGAKEKVRNRLGKPTRIEYVNPGKGITLLPGIYCSLLIIPARKSDRPIEASIRSSFDRYSQIEL
jgi:hypothetical protein